MKKKGKKKEEKERKKRRTKKTTNSKANSIDKVMNDKRFTRTFLYSVLVSRDQCRNRTPTHLYETKERKTDG